MKTKSIRIATVALLVLAAAGCASNSPVGVVDIARITANWKTFQDDQAQLNADEAAIFQSKAGQAQKLRELAALRRKYAAITDQLTQQIRQAAGAVAREQRLQLVVTREGVGYGGVDITSDVEKRLGIVESASPSPSP